MNLQNEQLSDFEPLIRNLYELAFSTERTARTLAFPSERAYVESCHGDWTSVQKRVAEEVISLDALKRHTQADLKRHRREISSDKPITQHFLNLINVIDNRTKVLRRLVDAIALRMLDNKVWVAKRFVLHDRLQKPDIEAIKFNLEFASRLDTGPEHFWLISDLTTFIGVGDFILRTYTGKRFRWNIFEIKIGKLNKILVDLSNLEGPPKEEVIAGLGPHAPKQLDRIIKQKNRTNEILKFINKGKGADIRTGIPLILDPKERVLAHYDDALIDAIDGAKRKQVSLCVVDGCLSVFASTLDTAETFHFLYHVVNGGVECAFEADDEAKKEHEYNNMLQLLGHPYVKDIILHNLNACCHTPFYLWPIENVMNDLLFDRMRVVLYLDIQKYCDLYTAKGFKVELLSKKETILCQKSFGGNLPLLNGRAIKLTNPLGNSVGLGRGNLNRIFFDLVRPISSLQCYDNLTLFEER
jgi:hypothetical protein